MQVIVFPSYGSDLADGDLAGKADVRITESMPLLGPGTSQKEQPPNEPANLIQTTVQNDDLEAGGLRPIERNAGLFSSAPCVSVMISFGIIGALFGLSYLVLRLVS